MNINNVDNDFRI